MNISTEMLERLVSGVQKIYADLLISIILYGSVARGTHTEESDIDIALILTTHEE